MSPRVGCGRHHSASVCRLTCRVPPGECSESKGVELSQAILPERWYLVAELSAITGFSKSSIYRAIRSGKLKAKSPSGGERYRRISGEQWLRCIGDSPEEGV